jgi:hypothetical protein
MEAKDENGLYNLQVSDILPLNQAVRLVGGRG